MSIDAYLRTVKERLLTDPVVVSFHVMRERATMVDGYIRARLVFTDESYLEFSEYVQTAADNIQVVTYSYQWATAENRLIKRWDNTPHFPNLPNFPHHIHAGVDVIPGQSIDIFAVLDQIIQSGNTR